MSIMLAKQHGPYSPPVGESKFRRNFGGGKRLGSKPSPHQNFSRFAGEILAPPQGGSRDGVEDEKMKPSKPFSVTTREILKDPALAALYLEECLEDGDMELFTAALKDVADAHGAGTSKSVKEN